MKRSSIQKYFLSFFCMVVLLADRQVSAQAPALDSAYLRCRYAFVWINDTASPDKKQGDFLVVNIGKKICETYSYNTYRVDSGFYTDISNGVPAAALLRSLTKYGKLGLGIHVLQNYPDRQLTYIDRFITKSFLSQEPMPDFHWQIEDKADTTILGHKVQKAFGEYAGRKYTVWFAPDIPVAAGPWKFSGLPGLIMKVREDNKWFWFVITGIEKVNRYC